MIKVLLWGIGGQYNKLFNLIQLYSQFNFDVVGITDNNPPQYDQIDGFKVVKKDEINNIIFDCVLVLSEQYYNEIRSEATNKYNISGDIIFPGRVLNIPYFDIAKLLHISKTHWTIVSNNCWGGMIYHSMGMECRSPFKNLSINENDYLRLISDFDYYMEECPVWRGEWCYDNNKRENVPLIRLRELGIKCNHYNDPEIAIEKWIERSKKINKDRLLIEMYTESRDVEKSFWATDASNYRICFVPFRTSFSGSVYLPMQNGQTKFYQTVNDSAKIEGRGYLYNLFSVFSSDREIMVRLK